MEGVMLLTLSFVMSLMVPATSPDVIQWTEGEFDRVALGGLRKVAVLVEDIDDEGIACNINKESLRLAAARPLVDAGIYVPDYPVKAHVDVSARRLSSGECVAFADVQVKAYAGVRVVHRPGPMLGTAELASYGDLIAGPASNFGSRVAARVRRFVEQFATRVKIANQK
jgi:hypothetical protein